jgi:hypothetical protein
MSGQIQAPAAYFRGRAPGIHLTRGRVGPGAGQDARLFHTSNFTIMLDAVGSLRAAKCFKDAQQAQSGLHNVRH